MSKKPAISILIRTSNSSQTLDAVLLRLPLQSGDEIIIVDSESKDSTLEIAKRHHARILNSKPPFNYSRTLNEGFEVASNPWVLVISSHCIPTHSGLLERLREVAANADEDLAVAYGIACLNEPKKISSHIEYGGYDDWKSGKFRFGGNVLALYRTELWKQQPFDEALPGTEDLAWFVWAAEAGHRAAVVHDALGFYRNQGSLRHMFRKGWFDTHLARAMSKATPTPTDVLLETRSFLINLAYLMSMFVTRRIPFSTFVRQTAHACGSFLASLFPRRHSSDPGSYTHGNAKL